MNTRTDLHASFASLLALAVVLAPASLASAGSAPEGASCTITTPANAPARFVSCVEPAGDVAIVTPGDHCVATDRKLPAAVRIRCEDDTVLVLDGSACRMENDPGYAAAAARCTLEPVHDAALRAHVPR